MATIDITAQDDSDFIEQQQLAAVDSVEIPKAAADDKADAGVQAPAVQRNDGATSVAAENNAAFAESQASGSDARQKTAANAEDDAKIDESPESIQAEPTDAATNDRDQLGAVPQLPKRSWAPEFTDYTTTVKARWGPKGKRLSIFPKKIDLTVSATSITISVAPRWFSRKRESITLPLADCRARPIFGKKNMIRLITAIARNNCEGECGPSYMELEFIPG